MRKVPGHAWRGLYPDHITHRRPVPELTLSSNILCLTSALRVGGSLDMALNIAAVWEPFRASPRRSALPPSKPFPAGLFTCDADFLQNAEAGHCILVLTRNASWTKCIDSRR